MTKRYQPSWPLPAYIFIPGLNPHPKKVGGHMEGESDPIAPLIDLNHPEKNIFFRYSVDLYNHGYYWEAHVYFEALWNAHNRIGSVADFLKALIKMCAAGVKQLINQTQNRDDHFQRACELFESVKKDEGDNFLGFDLNELIESCQKNFPNLRPSWE